MNEWEGEFGRTGQTRSADTRRNPDVYGRGGAEPRYEPPRYESPPREPKRRHRGVWTYAGIFVGIVLLCLLLNNLLNPAPSTGNSPYIAEIHVVGEISGSPSTDMLGNISGYYHNWTLNQIDNLMSDSNNAGLFVFVDTPGGGVYESDELYLKFLEYKKETGNPLYVAMGSMAASGGYYISAAADRIYANRNTWTGSIGVRIGTLVDISEFLDKYGVKTTTVTSGVNKSMGGYFEPITPEQTAIFQGLVDEAYDQFVEIIAEGRALEPEFVRSIADGRIYTAKQSLELGLVDEIGSADEALSDMMLRYGLTDCDITLLEYTDTSVLGRLLSDTALSRFASIFEQGDIRTVLRLAEEGGLKPVQYMYGP
jgi:protease-4